MKKNVMKFGMLVLAALLTAGCFGGDSETLRCTFEEEENGLLNVGEYIVEFSNDEPVKITIDMTNEFADEEEAEMYYGFSDEMYQEMSQDEGMEITTELDGNKINILMVIDETEFEEGTMQEDFFGIPADETMTRDSMREDLEVEGFDCN